MNSSLAKSLLAVAALAESFFVPFVVLAREDRIRFAITVLVLIILFCPMEASTRLSLIEVGLLAWSGDELIEPKAILWLRSIGWCDERG